MPVSDLLYNRLIKFEESESDYQKSFFSYLRTITTISTGMLGLLVALKPVEIHNEIARSLFLATISLLGIGIFFAAVTQFYEVVLMGERKAFRQRMLVTPPPETVQGMPLIENKNMPIFYVFSMIVTFVSLSASIAAMIAYVYFYELNIEYVF